MGKATVFARSEVTLHKICAGLVLGGCRRWNELDLPTCIGATARRNPGRKIDCLPDA